MNFKRILSITLALCLCLMMLPATVLANETENIILCGVDIGVKAGTHMQYSNAYGTRMEDGHYYNGVNLLGTQCMGFARWCQYNLFGYHEKLESEKFYNISINGVEQIPRGSLTVTNLKEMIAACLPGAHLRTYAAAGDAWGHSMVITEITDTGFSIVQCNGDYNNEYSGWKKNYIGTYTYTWDSYVNSAYGQRGIEFIKMPYEYPFQAEHTNHIFTGCYWESEHPHKVYQRCVCGELQYTEETATDFDCEICNPTDSAYNSLLPFKAYPIAKASPSATPLLNEPNGDTLQSNQECAVVAVYASGACKISYSDGSVDKTAYLSLSDFLIDPTAALTETTVIRRVSTYMHANTANAESYGYAGAGDTIYIVGVSGNMTQLFYHSYTGYKLAWVLTSELQKEAYDSRFDSYGILYGYPCAEEDFLAYEADRTTRSGSIWTTDDCIIHAIYADGWCLVTYPVSGGTRTGYARLSNFVYQPEFDHGQYYAREQTETFTNQALTTAIGHLPEGAMFYVVGTYQNATQILYSSQTQETGYQLAWIDKLETGATAVHRYEADGKEVTMYYSRLEDALSAASSGTVELLVDTSVNTAFISPNVTLDLNGKILSANILVAMNGATILDGGENCTGGGALRIARESLIFARNNGQNIIPVWNGADGYLFTKVTFQQLSRTDEAGVSQYIFLPAFTNQEASALMADGGIDNGIQIQACLTWSEGKTQQFYTYRDDLIKQVFDGTNRWVFHLKITGIAGLTDMTASPVVISDCGTQVTEPGVLLTAEQ